MFRILQHGATTTAIALAALIIALVALFSPRGESTTHGISAEPASVAEGRWVEYVYLNPNTGFRELKHSWVVRHDGLIFGSGWYELQRPSVVEFV